ncbi:MAG: hypothetical protein ACYSWO_15765 [Planctomycetota bacterium]|jgi:hypothetical protein
MKAIDKYGARNARLILLVLATVGPTAACLGSSSTEDSIHKYYAVDINFFSVDLARPMDSYRWHGGGNAGTGGTVGLGCSDDVRNFRIRVSGKNVEGRFVVTVSVTPGETDSATKEGLFDVDFTDLKAQSLELAKNDDGRVYMLNLTPGIAVVDNRPKRADDTSFRFSKWSLHDSMVIFNDSVYAGKLGVSGGPLAYVSYPGFAKVEFALIPFRGAKRLGTLKDGKIQIRSEDGQSLDIYGVKNGVHRIQLPGGPYEVWARWQDLPGKAEVEVPPKEEWIRMVKAHLLEKGEPPPAEEELDKLYERAKHQRSLPLSSGVRSIGQSDRIDD